MAIPDEIRKCVFFVGYRMADGSVHLAGTAFCLARMIEGTASSWPYVVTARHVIDHIRNLGIDKVLLRVNHKSGGAIWAETNIGHWWISPEGPSVDVAVIRYRLEIWDHLSIPLGMFVTDELIEKEGIGVGDEVFMTGLFSPHFGERNNIPIVRVGNISAMPGEKVNTRVGPMHAYLIECRSIGGLSGSPVFVNLGLVRHGKFSSTGKPIFYFLGLIYGHYDIDEVAIDANELDPVADDGLRARNVNMGIAIVVPASKILEILNLPSLRAEEHSAEEELRKKSPPTQNATAQAEQSATKQDLPTAKG